MGRVRRGVAAGVCTLLFAAGAAFAAGVGGAWSMAKLALGTYTVTISLAGYSAQTFNMSVVGGSTVLAATELTHS